MTTAADDAAVEDAFEAYLAGRPVSGAAADSFPGLAAFSEAVRATATQPGRPNAALAELLATGLLADQSSPSARTARSAGSPPARRSARVRIRRRTAMFFPVLLAKFLSAGAIAQAATGAGVAVVVVTGAGAAGVLPDPVQNTVATVVANVSPLELPTAEEPVVEEPVAEEPVLEEPVAEEPVVLEPVAEEPAGIGAFDAETWASEGPDAYSSFGAWVSAGSASGAFGGEGARFGAIVSSHARQKGLDEAELEAEGVDLGELTGDTAEPAPEVEAGTAEDSTEQRSTGNGRGNGNGNAAGNGNGNGNGNAAGNGRGNGRN